MSFIYLINGFLYFIGFESLSDPDTRYINVIENQNDIVLMPVSEKGDDPDSSYYSDIIDPGFKAKMMQIFDRSDFPVLAFVELYGSYYSKSTQPIDVLDALKMCCDFRDIDEVSVRVI